MPNHHDPDRLDRIEAALQNGAGRFEAADRRLQQRHECLARSVQLLASLHRDNQVHLAQLMETTTRLPNLH